MGLNSARALSLRVFPHLYLTVTDLNNPKLWTGLNILETVKNILLCCPPLIFEVYTDKHKF